MLGLTVLTYGTALPMGLFVPNIIFGACFGRMVGQGLQDWLRSEAGNWAEPASVHPGVYALIGATAMLAGGRAPPGCGCRTRDSTRALRWAAASP